MLAILTITNAGLALLVDAEAGVIDPLIVTEVGLTNVGFVPDAAQTTLAGEFKRVDTIAGLAVDDTTIHLTMIDSEAVAYTVRGFGLYLEDGTLFAVYGQAGTIFAKGAAASFFLALDIKLAPGQAELIEFGDVAFAYPPASQTVAGVLELATQGEVDAGLATNLAVSPATLAVRITGFIPLAQRGAVNGVASLDAGGKVPTGQLPSLAITNTFVRTSEAAMLALVAEPGDFCIRTDESTTYVLSAAPATTLANWVELLFAVSVVSVNGQTGTVLLDAADIGAVPPSRSIATTGLITGGGNLDANRTFDVAKATGPQIRAGLIDDVAATPAGLADAYPWLAAENGYVTLSGGMILQWGRFLAYANTSTTVTFPLEFPNACFSVVVSGTFGGDDDSQDNTAQVVASTIDGNSFAVFSADDTSNTTCFIAIGR